jgi:Fur family ferric uptake transcriptional regulator
LGDDETHSDKSRHQRVESALETFNERLREEGKKSTKQRELIVEQFFGLDEHITADELHQVVSEKQPRIGYATVYRTLKLLVEQDLAVPKDFGDGQTRYDPIHDQDPHHDHLICIDCRKIVEFNDDEINHLLEKLAAEKEYSISRKRIELYSKCERTECPHKEAG